MCTLFPKLCRHNRHKPTRMCLHSGVCWRCLIDTGPIVCVMDLISRIPLMQLSHDSWLHTHFTCGQTSCMREGEQGWDSYVIASNCICIGSYVCIYMHLSHCWCSGIFDSVDCHTLFLPATRKNLLQDLSRVKQLALGAHGHSHQLHRPLPLLYVR